MSSHGGDHRDHVEAVGAYVLGALDEDERSSLERHLETCRSCRKEAAALQLAVEALPASAPSVDPPPQLKDRVMAVVRSEAELLAVSGASADRPPRQRARGWGRLFPRPAITAAAAAAALGAGVVGGIAVVNDRGSRQPQATQRVLAARITDPSVPADARAAVRLSGGEASLVVHGLPDPPTRRVYQVWTKAPGNSPVPAGATFAVRSGTIDIPRRLHDGDQVLVTVEPLGGSPAPTRAPTIVTPPT